MAKTINLYDGGAPQYSFPGCDNIRKWDCPLPNQIAGEYGRGDFTLGTIFQPAAISHQAAAVEGLKKSDFPTVVNLLVIPQLHSMTEVFVRVLPDAYTGNFCGAPGAADGVVFNVVGKMVNLSDCANGDVLEAYAAGEDYELPDVFSDINAAEHGAYHAFLDTSKTITTTVETPNPDPEGADTQTSTSATTTASGTFVPEGKALILGLQFTSGPSTEGVTLDMLTARLALVVKAGNFEFPIHL